jgi:hypothetical protein
MFAWMRLFWPLKLAGLARVGTCCGSSIAEAGA